MNRIFATLNTWFDQSLAKKMTALIILCSSLFALIATAVQLFLDYKSELTLVNEGFEYIDESYAASLADSLWTVNERQIELQLEGIHNLPFVQHVELNSVLGMRYQAGDRVIVGTTLQKQLPLFAPHSKHFQKIGVLTVEVAMDQIYRRLFDRLLVILVTQTVKTFVVAMFVLMLFQFFITRHLSKIANFTSRLTPTNLNKSLTLSRSVDNNDELSKLENAINEMRTSMQDSIAEQQRVNFERQKLFLAVEQSPVAVAIADTVGNIEYFNPAFSEGGGKFVTLADKFMGCEPEVRQRIFQAIDENETWKGELLMAYRQGGQHWENCSVTPIKNIDGKVSHFLVLLEDISESKRYQHELIHRANYDALTGLPNRTFIFNTMNRAVGRSAKDSLTGAVMYLDLDHFKYVNDTFGHAVGDELLIQVSNRLKHCVDAVPGAIVSRLGGDEFLIVIPELSNRDDAIKMAKSIITKFVNPFALEQTEVFMSPSIGITFFPEDGNDPAVLLCNADSAMYKSKTKGRNCYSFFTPAMSSHSKNRLTIETELRYAIDRNELEVYYQPILDVSNNKVIGAEALIRWESQMLGTILPDQFLPTAEETGLIIDIGGWVIKEACIQASKWQQSLIKDFAIAFNASPRQILDENFLGIIEEAIAETNIKPSTITLEVTEHMLLANTQVTLGILEALTDKEINLSLDDFGTGYSALSYLKMYPFSVLKIDRSFIAQVVNDSGSCALVRAIIALAHELGMDVVAEGVEHFGQLAFLRDEKCDQAQGFFLGKPMSVTEFEEYIKSRS